MAESFAELMGRVRAGDPTAVHAVAERFGPQLLRSIRVRMAGSKLRRVIGSDDLLQSVLGIFWVNRQAVRADQPGQVLVWLRRVAEHRLMAHGRKAAAEKHGGGQANAGSAALAAVAADGPSPPSEVATRDLLEQVMTRLRPADRQIAQARADGVEWDELARQMGTTAEALRKRFTRAVRELEG